MNLYTKIIGVAIVVGAVLGPLSCKKSFLNPVDTNAAQITSAFTKPQQVEALVNTIYNTYQSSDLLKKSIWYYANFLTHDWYNNGSDIVWNYYGITAGFYALPTFWNNAYIGIARANAALEVIAETRANGVLTPSSLADRLEGECYFLRGMTYYYLAGTFGGVPLELKAETNGLTPRSSQDSVFKQVVSDMHMAEQLLVSKTKLSSADIGRATTGAAYGYEGAAQMWLKQYDSALTAFNNPELNNYHLLPNFVDVHEYSNQNNAESLFEIQFNVYGSQSWDGGWQDGGQEGWIDDFGWPQEISGFGYDYGNPGLYYSYQAGDLRRACTIGGPGDTLVSPGIIAKWGGIKGYAVVQAGDSTNPTVYSDGTGKPYKPINSIGTVANPWYGNDGTPRSGFYDTKKWRDPTLTGANGTSAIFGGQNQIMLRYAEILLDRAECKVHTGDIAGAMADLQTVRNRAWGGTAPAVMQDGLTWDGKPTQPITDPMQMVLSEYRHELTAEFSLMYDLRRAGPGVASTFIQQEYGTTPSQNQIVYPYGPTADGHTHGVWMTTLPANKDILPIPQSAIALNPYLTQNPSY